MKTETFNLELEDFLRSKGMAPIVFKDENNNDLTTAHDATQFVFNYKNGSREYGTVVVTTHNNITTIWFNNSVVRDDNKRIDTKWPQFVHDLKDFSLSNGNMTFKTEPLDKLGGEMANRRKQLKDEKLLEGYYGTRFTSYNNTNPSIKMIIKHGAPIGEGDARFRNIERIFLETSLGERLLLNTKKPSIGRAFARHLAEGGQYNDERWKHISEIAEDISKLGGFVRATKTKQFNESIQQVVNEAMQHYQSLRETIRRLQSSRGYNSYFESWQPTLMEEGGEQDFASMFVASKLDPRIESAIPVLNKLKIRVSEMVEANEFENWANSIVEGLSAEDKKHIDDLVELLNKQDKLAVGPEGMSIKGQLDEIIVNDKDKRDLFAEIDKVAKSPDFDAKPVIISWLQEHSDEEFYGDVLDKLDSDVVKKSTSVAQPPKMPAKPKPQAAAPAAPAAPAGVSPQDAQALQKFMPEAEEIKEKKNTKTTPLKKRNFVAKHAQKSGAGVHGVKGYKRHPKHKAKNLEEFNSIITFGEVEEGYKVVPTIDNEKYGERQGLEGPFRLDSGKIVYYDPVEGKYYDPNTDLYLDYDEYQSHVKEGVPEIDKDAMDAIVDNAEGEYDGEKLDELSRIKSLSGLR